MHKSSVPTQDLFRLPLLGLPQSTLASEDQLYFTGAQATLMAWLKMEPISLLVSHRGEELRERLVARPLTGDAGPMAST